MNIVICYFPPLYSVYVQILLVLSQMCQCVNTENKGGK